VVPRGTTNSTQAPSQLSKAPTPPVPYVFQDPDELWKLFKATFKFSDAERRNIEKNVRVSLASNLGLQTLSLIFQLGSRSNALGVGRT
jgi:hypothetical protein